MSLTGIYGEGAYGEILYGGDVEGDSNTLRGTAGLVSGKGFGTGGAVSGNQTVTGAAGLGSGKGFGTGGSIASILLQLTGVAGLGSGKGFGTGGSIAGPITGVAGLGSGKGFGSNGVIFPAGTVVGLVGLGSGKGFGTGGKVVANVFGGHGGLGSGKGFGTGGRVGDAATNSGFAFYLNGLLVNRFARINTLSLTKQLGSRSTCNFAIGEIAGNYRPQIGDTVEVWFLGAKTFAGSIEETDESYLDNTGNYLQVQVQATDYGIICDRRVIGAFYSAVAFGTVNSIVQAIVDTYLAVEGITFIPSDDSDAVLGDVLFNWVTISDAFSQLTQLSGFEWRIDYDKNLYFFDPSIGIRAAAFDLAQDDSNWRNMVVKRLRSKFRNVQYIRSNAGVTQNQTASTTASGVPTQFDAHGVTWFGIGAQNNPQVLIDSMGVPYSPYLFANYQMADVNAGKYNVPGYNLVVPGTPPFTGPTSDQPYAPQTIIVRVYMASTPSPVDTGSGDGGALDAIVMIRREESIADLAAADGGSGMFEEVESAPDIQDKDTALALAEGLLERFCDTGFPIQIEYQTDKPGLEPGDTQHINLAQPLVDDLDVVIFSSTVQGVDGQFTRAQIIANNGPTLGNFVSFYQKLIGLAKSVQRAAIEQIIFLLAKTVSGATNPGILTGTNVTGVQQPIRTTGIFRQVDVRFNTAPATAVTIDIKMAGSSILSSQIVYPAGSTALITYVQFSSSPKQAIAGELLSIDIPTGSGGADATVTIVKYA